MACLDDTEHLQRSERLTQRGSADAECFGEFPFCWEPLSGDERAHADLLDERATDLLVQLLLRDCGKRLERYADVGRPAVVEGSVAIGNGRARFLLSPR